MKRKFQSIAAFALELCMVGILVAGILITNQFSAGEVNTQTSDMITIIIDPGHGGPDPGKTGTLKDEKHINLAIALRLEKKLTEKGFHVLMTRAEDVGLYQTEGAMWDKTADMNIRKKLVTDSSASLMLSIHQNSYPDSRCRGAQVFYNTCLEENKRLAELFQEKLKGISPVENKRAALVNDNLKMLKNNPMPSAIVECGFLSNKEEEYLLGTEEYQGKLVNALYEGICEFFSLSP